MARIRGKNTAPERHLRSVLHRMGVRFRLHQKDLPGRPDILVLKYQAVIFVHGCFWHRHRGCILAYQPKTRVAFWNHKFAENVERDEAHMRVLRRSGWRVGIVWECSLRSVSNRADAASTLMDWLRSSHARIEIPPLRCAIRTGATKEPHGAAVARSAQRVKRHARSAGQVESNTRSGLI